MDGQTLKQQLWKLAQLSSHLDVSELLTPKSSFKLTFTGDRDPDGAPPDYHLVFEPTLFFGVLHFRDESA